MFGVVGWLVLCVSVLARCVIPMLVCGSCFRMHFVVHIIRGVPVFFLE
jgi:hypothetical protein